MAYLQQIKTGNIKCSENLDFMGDDILHFDQAKIKDQLFKIIDQNPKNDQYMVKIFKSVFVNMQ